MNERPSRSWTREWVPEEIPSIETIAVLAVMFTVGLAIGNVAVGESVGQQIWLVWVLFPAAVALSIRGVVPRRKR